MIFQFYVGNCYINGNAVLNDRYSLIVDFNTNNNGLNAIVFLLNPSSTGKQNIFYNVNALEINDVDLTTNAVIDRLHNEIGNNGIPKYQTIGILNLFPYFDSKPSSINMIYGNAPLNTIQSYVNNMNEIDRILHAYCSADIYLAWGKDVSVQQNILNNAKQDVVNLLTNHGFTSVFYKSAMNATAFSTATMNNIINLGAIHGKYY